MRTSAASPGNVQLDCKGLRGGPLFLCNERPVRNRVRLGYAGLLGRTTKPRAYLS